MQQLQQIYAELTGKAESLSKYYDDPIRVGYDDIEQLHHRILQTWEQYNVVSSNCTFTFYYLKNTKDQFNSFERLKLQISSGADPVESALIKYDVLLILPNVTKPQNYSISVRLVSRLALEKRMREIPFTFPRFIRMMANHTGSLEFTYVDYSVARAFVATIDEWFQTIPRSNENKIMKALQNYSHWIPRLVRLVTVAVSVGGMSEIMPHFIHEKDSDFLHFGLFSMWAGLAVYAAYLLAGWSARFAEISVDSWTNVSYIKLNRADELEVAKSKEANRNHILKGGLGLVGAVCVNVAVELLAVLIVRLM